MRFGQRRGLSVLLITAMAAGLAVLAVPAGAGASNGQHEHFGANGETDVNVCSDAVAPGQAHCLARVRTDSQARQASPTSASRSASSAAAVHGAATIGNGGAYDPAYLQSAYNAPSATLGAGQTVAIVDAYDDPNAAADLAAYRSFFGLPACGNGCFQKVNEFGDTSYPAADSGWSQEIALDLDMVSAMCPLCHILLVEANTSYLSDLGTAVNTAVSLGANVVSNSYGGGEYNGETNDSAAYYHHPGIAVVASSGDSGYGVEFPAASADVTAVGGTSLIQNSNTGSRNGSETAWSGAGSGCSAYVAKPSWQHDGGCPRRTVADVSAVADPNTGVWVYDTYGTGGSWLIFGGTSVASPIIGSMYALAANGASSDNLSSYPYSHTANLFDVTSGSNGSCAPSYLCTAGVGYDGPTGLGTPNSTPAFSGAPAVPVPPSPPVGLSANPANGSVTLSWSTPTNTGGAPITGYHIYRGTTTGGETSLISVNTTGYTDMAVTNGTTYYYVVAAQNSAGEGAQSNEASAMPQAPSVPSAPRSLSATGGNTNVTLSWLSPSSTGGSPITYQVFRGTSPAGESSTALATGLTTTSYSDTSVTNGTTYYYTVKAFNTTGLGPASNESSATPAGAPGVPTLSAVSSSTRGVVLTWSAPASNGSPITKYVIYRSTSSGRESSYVTLTCTSSCPLSYTDTNTRRGTTYYYQVAAVNAVGTGPRSAQRQARAS